MKSVRMTMYLDPTAQQVCLIFVQSDTFRKVDSLNMAILLKTPKRLFLGGEIRKSCV